MQAWDLFLSSLQQEIGTETVEKWLRPLQVVHFDACNLYLEAPDPLLIDWFEEHVRAKAKKKLLNNNFHPIKVHISHANLQESAPKEKKKIAPLPPFSLLTDALSPSFRFDTFLTNPNNQIAFELLRQLDRKDSIGQFNPIYLYGSACCGKTHLLQATAFQCQELQKKTLYVKAETFTENVVRAIRTSNMKEFRQAHRDIDVLIFDDVQILAKKTATQEEFFHTFNTLHMQGKQIVLSANSPAALLSEIEPRLISRFEWGISLSVGKLEGNDLLKMLEQRCDALAFPLSKTVLQFLLETFSFNVKSLHKALEALILRSHSLQKTSTLTVPIVRHMLQDLIEEEKKEILTPEKILSSVAGFYSLLPKDILSKSQTHEYTLPRQLSMYLCRIELKMPYVKIGQFFDRDHSTVMTSVKGIEEKIAAQDKEISHALLLIRRNLDA